MIFMGSNPSKEQKLCNTIIINNNNKEDFVFFCSNFQLLAMVMFFNFL